MKFLKRLAEDLGLELDELDEKATDAALECGTKISSLSAVLAYREALEDQVQP